jgi:hypothetical protein
MVTLVKALGDGASNSSNGNSSSSSSGSSSSGSSSSGNANRVLWVLDLSYNLAELGEPEAADLAAALSGNQTLRLLGLTGNRVDTKAQMFIHGWLKLKDRYQRGLVQL